MYINNWKKEILTLPNLLSLMRILVIPVYAQVYLNADTLQEHFLAAASLSASLSAAGFALPWYLLVPSNITVTLGNPEQE